MIGAGVGHPDEVRLERMHAHLDPRDVAAVRLLAQRREPAHHAAMELAGRIGLAGDRQQLEVLAEAGREPLAVAAPRLAERPVEAGRTVERARCRTDASRCEPCRQQAVARGDPGLDGVFFGSGRDELAKAAGGVGGQRQRVRHPRRVQPEQPSSDGRSAEGAIGRGGAKAARAEVRGMVAADPERHLVAGCDRSEQGLAVGVRRLGHGERRRHHDDADVSGRMRILLDADVQQHGIGDRGRVRRGHAAVKQPASTAPAKSRLIRLGFRHTARQRSAGRRDPDREAVEQAGARLVEHGRWQIGRVDACRPCGQLVKSSVRCAGHASVMPAHR